MGHRAGDAGWVQIHAVPGPDSRRGRRRKPGFRRWRAGGGTARYGDQLHWLGQATGRGRRRLGGDADQFAAAASAGASLRPWAPGLFTSARIVSFPAQEACTSKPTLPTRRTCMAAASSWARWTIRMPSRCARRSSAMNLRRAEPGGLVPGAAGRVKGYRKAMFSGCPRWTGACDPRSCAPEARSAWPVPRVGRADQQVRPAAAGGP